MATQASPSLPRICCIRARHSVRVRRDSRRAVHPGRDLPTLCAPPHDGGTVRQNRDVRRVHDGHLLARAVGVLECEARHAEGHGHSAREELRRELAQACQHGVRVQEDSPAGGNGGGYSHTTGGGGSHGIVKADCEGVL